MIFGRSKVELKVGIFIFIGLVILSIFILSIGNFKTWASGYHISVVFRFINGLKVGAPVRFAGVDVGEIKKINIYFDSRQKVTKVALLCWIKEDIKIPVDSQVWVNTLGLLGEKYVEIMPGATYENVLKEGDTIVGVDPLPMHEVGRLAKDIGERINNLLEQSTLLIQRLNSQEGTVGKLLYSDSLHKHLENLVIQLEKAVEDISKNPWKLLWKPKEKPSKK